METFKIVENKYLNTINAYLLCADSEEDYYNGNTDFINSYRLDKSQDYIEQLENMGFENVIIIK